MTIERAREILGDLVKDQPDEYVEKLMEQMRVLAQLNLEQGPNLPLYLNSLRRYDENADNKPEEASTAE